MAHILLAARRQHEKIGRTWQETPPTRSTPRIGGTVTDHKDSITPSASVCLDDLGLSATTDSSDRFFLMPARPGTFTLRVQAGKRIPEVPVEIPAPKGADYHVQWPPDH